MVSHVARHLVETLGIIAFAALPATVFAQPQPERDRVDEKERIAEEMLAAQAKEGPRSPALIQLFTELGVLYETEGRYQLATAALEQARQLVRANYGLYTLDQVPLLEQAMANQQALGNFAMARAIEEELLDLAERNPNDVRAAAIHRDAGRRRQDVLRRFLAGEAPDEVYPEAGVYSFFRNDMVRELVADSQIQYADAAAVLLRSGLYSSDELRDLETEIVRTSDVVRQRGRSNTTSSTTMATAPRTMQQNTFSSTSNSRLARDRNRDLGLFYNAALEERTNMLSDLASRAALQDAPAALQDVAEPSRGDGITSGYEVGRNSYLRVIAYDEAAFGDPAGEAALRNRLKAYLQLADWDLLYSQNGSAFDQYTRVHELLETTPFAERLIAELFAPPVPIILPTFLPNPLETPASDRYIDVAFEITKYGESRRVEIAGAAPSVADGAKDELLSLIKSARFRPRVASGDLGRPAPVTVRYYLN